MKKIAACYKWVVDEADIRVEGANHSLNFDRVKYKISEYDRNALEQGALLSEETGCEFVAVTCGTDVKASLKDVLSRGPGNVYYLEDQFMAAADSQVTAKVLAGMLKQIGEVDLIICGEGSGDDYSQQVGPRLAALLGYASLSFVNKVELTPAGIKAERKLEDGVEVVEVNGPAVVTVLPDINKPRIPSLKQILAAKKKPATELAAAELGLREEDCRPKLTTLSIAGSVMERKQIRMNSEGVPVEEAVEKLVKQLELEGALD
ncbi:MAG: electron transfer flavoprotein subunit beta/FixA family protein [Peptococcaceae bacterium]